MPTQKILIIRFSSIGDIVLTTPVIRCLKNQIDDVVLHYCTKEAFKGIVSNNPGIDKVHVLGKSLSDLVNELKKEKFDLVIDLHNNLRTHILTWRLGVKTRRFNKINFQKWLLVKLKINRMPNNHIVDRYLETLSELQIKNDQKGLDYFIPHRDEVEMTWLPKTHRKEYVAVVVGAQHATKRLPIKRLIELCDKINKPIVIVGGPDDAKVGEEIESFFKKNDASAEYEEKLQELGKKSVVFNACGKFNLNQSASIVKQAKIVFSHDTGLMHIAAAFKKEIFSIWGNTVPSFGMYPYETKFTVLENPNLECRPCSKIGFDKCPKGHFKCMNEIKFDFYIP